MRRTVLSATAATVLLAGPIAACAAQTPVVRPVDEKTLREYGGAYRWEGDAFLYLQLWNEFMGTNQLVAFDESGELRTLYPTDRDRFSAGPGAAVSTALESRIQFQRDGTGKITSLAWHRHRDGSSRVARRADIANQARGP